LVNPATVARVAGGLASAAVPPGLATYDEGATWLLASLTGSVAVVDHPADATTVSLRASARDSAGNTVKQSFIRANHLN
jgi:hypothetical protein